MATISTKKTTSLRIDSELYSFIESLAKKENRSINNYIETLLFNVTGFGKINEETKKAIAEVEKNKDSLKRYSDLNKLLKDLEK